MTDPAPVSADQNMGITPGPKVILMGASGSWKSSALQSLPALGITPYVVATEQNFIQVNKKFLGSKMHYIYMPAQPPQAPNQVVDMLKKINDLSYENLTKVVDPFKRGNNRLVDLGSTLNVFKCDCCQKIWGSPTTWNTDRAYVIDSMSGLSDMAFALVVGNKPVRAPPDYGVAQNAIRMILNIAVNMKTHFILISHIEKEQDKNSGAYVLTIKSVGEKLGPDLPRSFSDVILAKKDGAGKVVWDTADAFATVVGRHLPAATGLEPNFSQLMKTWIEGGGKIEATA